MSRRSLLLLLSRNLSSLSSKIIYSITLILSINSLFFFPSCHSLDEQGKALLAWKKSLNGSSNDAALLASWNPSNQTPCNNWFGVKCNSENEVIEINLNSVNLLGSSLPSNLQPLKSLKILALSSTNISGRIPTEFGDYQELISIDLSGNSLSGEIPEEICKLRKLESLELHDNSLEGKIPFSIGNLSNLVNLTLFDNKLSGEVPKSIGFLRNLQVFRAGGNKNLKGELPFEIGNCTNLIMLGLAETGISGSIPSSIGMLRRLQTIAIYTTLLSGSIPEEIVNCSELQNVYLYQNSISGSIPPQIGKLSKLQNLFLWQNNLVGTIPESLGSCTELNAVDLSQNLLTGSIPKSFGKLSNLQVLQLSVNQISGTIPDEISNCTCLNQIEVDNNAISGEIPSLIGKLRSLTLFFAWKNKLTGRIPDSLSDCKDLQELDLSYNSLIGSIPKRLFGLKNLSKLLLISNEFSGLIPPDIGNCTSLYRLRLNQNKFSGTIPSEIISLKNLNFLDLGSNHLVGEIPQELHRCRKLEFLDLHSNGLTGSVPYMLPRSLQFIDFSDNRLEGELNHSIGSLTELTKLNLGKNHLSGRIPSEIASCSKLQLLDLGGNAFSGEIPKEVGQIPSLEIALNLSYNQFYGEIPAEFSGLSKLGALDLSHNKLSGKLDALAELQNLVSLNVSFNHFSGELPNTPFFREIPISDITSNDGLFIAGAAATHKVHARLAMKIIMCILLITSAAVALITLHFLIRAYITNKSLMKSENWEINLYQKSELSFSVDDIVNNLISANVIGTGSSGVVYKVETGNGKTLAVKKMWTSSSSESNGGFSSEIKTLGSIRHKNIIKLLGSGSNKNKSMNLLFYEYLPNGSLSSLLHGSGKGNSEWETRYDIVLGLAHALAYLHHDCVPPIIHGDVKSMNVLLGHGYHPYLADFGHARIVAENADADTQRPYLAGSYGYMAPEHALMQSITEKSDVYSFGVVLLEVLTGRHPLDPTLAEGANLVNWVKNHLANKGEPFEIIDTKLRGRRNDPTMQNHEILQTLAVSFLCVSNSPDERPTMKDTVAMLKEIRPFGEASTL
ncbi:hypothetical protein PIB30_071830 [Stylosanthes scabra]|uniref:Protein kinase domain-containing protein n=1 Tax=Stylosanthes scabra TaxID=79078 RepID=A0ABU6ZML7_9FABA|nr:hypothetical protein [Stylosanthes scabra]